MDEAGSFEDVHEAWSQEAASLLRIQEADRSQVQEEDAQGLLQGVRVKSCEEDAF